MSSPHRFIVLSFLVTSPYLVASCSEGAPEDGGASGTGATTAGTGMAGTGGSAGSATAGGGGSGGSTAGNGAGGAGPTAGTGGSAGSASGAAGKGGGAGTGGSAAGTAGTGGSSGGTGGSTGGSGGSGGSTGGAGAGGAGGAFGGAGAGGGGGTGGGSGEFTLTSSKLTPGEEMPADFTCEGDAHSPPFEWSGVPAGPMSFAMLLVDTTIAATMPDSGMAWHHAIWDIPATATGLPEDMPTTATVTTPVPCKQFNPLQCDGYLGPCANREDTYEFRLYALPVAELTGSLTSVVGIRDAVMDANPLGEAVLPVKANASGSLSCPK
jgi:Raf kinase inhibitor-like YbhB/YbcL family protein